MRYIFGIHGKENAFAQCGSLAHSILERYAKGQLELYELADTFDKEFDDAVTMRFPHFFCDLRKKYHDDIVVYFDHFNGFGKYKILGVEDKFNVDIDDWTFTGIIDLLLEDPEGNLVVLDHKSKAEFKSKKEMHKYARQLYLYAFYVETKYGKRPTKLVFNMFRKRNIVEIPFSEEDYQEALQWARDTVAAIRTETEYEPTFDDFFCENLCDFRGKLCKYHKSEAKK